MARKSPQTRLQRRPRTVRKPARDLEQAFALFTEVSNRLETSYQTLTEEAARLRLENEQIRAQLVRILENLPCGVIVLDQQNHVRLANPQARDLCDLSSESLAILREVQEGGEVEIALGSRQLGVTCTFREGFAIYLLREASQMALLLANEIRKPLGSLELFAGLMADSVHDHPETRQWCDHLQAGLRQVSATVHNALYHHGLPLPRRAAVNLTRMLRESAEFLRPLARQKGMRLELELDPNPSTIEAEQHTLQQVFFNLAINAFRAMTPGGVLTISTRRENQSLLVVFSDQGAGIPAEHLGRIFEPGFSSTAAPGLGLAVSRKIVAQQGGDISVTSTVGQGSQFTVAFGAAV